MDRTEAEFSQATHVRMKEREGEHAEHRQYSKGAMVDVETICGSEFAQAIESSTATMSHTPEAASFQKTPEAGLQLTNQE